MAGHAKGPRPLGYKARESVEDVLMHLHDSRLFTERIIVAAEHSNYQLVIAAAMASLRETERAVRILGDAVNGRY